MVFKEGEREREREREREQKAKTLKPNLRRTVIRIPRIIND